MDQKPRKPLLVNLTWAVVLVFVLLVPVYVLSYAPAVKWQRSHGRYVLLDGMEPTIDGRTLPFYKPVDWLIDNTPLRRRLFWWASVWGVEILFENDHWGRTDPCWRAHFE